MRPFVWSWPTESTERTRHGKEIARVLNVPEPIGQVLSSRGLDAFAVADIAERSLRSATEAIGDPPGVEGAAATILKAARRGRVGIICDYDVDGATSQAILIETLRAILPGRIREPVVAVPERNTEGFGPNVRCLNQLANEGVSCAAILDCGTASGRLLDRFHGTTGIETVVIDHHPPHGDPPPAAGSIVNPWVGSDADPGEPGTLCASALTWFVARSVLRQAGMSASGTARLRKRITLLAALGTSCDVMRIDTPFNRALVRKGVALLADPRTRMPGLSGIWDFAGVRRSPNADDFGWRIGPRLNAGSRMGESDLAARCLREKKRRVARRLAERLDAHNSARRALGDRAREELDSSRLTESFARGPVNVCVVKAATPGTAGLAASALVKRFGWPAIVLSKRENGSLAGSGRSALDFNIGEAVSAARHDGLLISGGGHAAACGLELEATRLSDLRRSLQERFSEHAATTGGPKEPTYFIDAVLKAGALSGGSLLAVAEAQQRLEPWGQGLPFPLFGVRNCVLAKPPRRRKGHVFLSLASDDREFNAVWWSAPPDWQRRFGIDAGEGGSPGGASSPNVEILGRVALDDWAGHVSGRIVLKDARVSGA